MKIKSNLFYGVLWKKILWCVVGIFVWFLFSGMKIDAASTAPVTFVYKENGQYYEITDTSYDSESGQIYLNIKRNAAMYLKIPIDNELYPGSTLKTYVTYGTSGTYDTRTITSSSVDWAITMRIILSRALCQIIWEKYASILI